MTKSTAFSPSKAKAFALDKIMRQASNTTVSPDRETKSLFGVQYETSFAFSDDGRHVIAPDASDGSRILVEDLSSGSGFGFGGNQRSILTVFFVEDTRTLLVGDADGYLTEYDLDLHKGEGRLAKRHGDLGVGQVWASSGGTAFVFFGGQFGKVIVYDLAVRKVLPGVIDTAIGSIFSLQVRVVDESRVYIAVAGENNKYSSTESDLYELSGLLGEVSLPDEVVNENLRVSCTDTDQVKTQGLRIKKLALQVSGSEIKSKGKCLNSELSMELKTMTRQYQEQRSENQEIFTQYKNLKEKFEEVKSDKMGRRVPQNNLLLRRVLEKNGGLPQEAFDSEDTSDEEDIRRKTNNSQRPFHCKESRSRDSSRKSKT